MAETGYLAPEGFEDELADELGGDVTARHGRLILARGAPRAPAWCENVWLDPRPIEAASIADAARQLRALGPRWALYAHKLHRRAELVHARVPRANGLTLGFLEPLPATKPGSFTLLEPGLLLASARCSSPLANGEARFREDKSAPSRAYLKLWELFTLHGARPAPGHLCLDLGSSPGGWTWVLHSLGARVVSVDKAPLAPAVARLPNVEWVKKDAFKLDPNSIEPVDWLFSDVICDPRRLWDLVDRWRASGRARAFACTLKFKGGTDSGIATRFASVPGSRLLHLHHNKHELTWILPPNRTSVSPAESLS